MAGDRPCCIVLFEKLGNVGFLTTITLNLPYAKKGSDHKGSARPTHSCLAVGERMVCVECYWGTGGPEFGPKWTRNGPGIGVTPLTGKSLRKIPKFTNFWPKLGANLEQKNK